MKVVREIGGEEVDQEVAACPPVPTAVTKTETEMGDGGDEDGALATLETGIGTVTVTTLKAKTAMATPIEVPYLTQAGRGTGTGTVDPVPRQEIAARETTEIETAGVLIPLRDLGATAGLDLRIEGGLEGTKDGNDLQEVVRTHDH